MTGKKLTFLTSATLPLHHPPCVHHMMNETRPFPTFHCSSTSVYYWIVKRGDLGMRQSHTCTSILSYLPQRWLAMKYNASSFGTLSMESTILDPSKLWNQFIQCKLIPQSAHSLIPSLSCCQTTFSFMPKLQTVITFTLPLPMTQYIYCQSQAIQPVIKYH